MILQDIKPSILSLSIQLLMVIKLHLVFKLLGLILFSVEKLKKIHSNMQGPVGSRCSDGAASSPQRAAEIILSGL